MNFQFLYDINCDLGEGSGNDEQLMPFIDSCNIACGGHFGTLTTMQETINSAQNHQVKIGAHPSYPDTENFGRQIMAISETDLRHSLVEQMLCFKQACQLQGAELHHIKLHGALYNVAAQDSKIATLVLSAISKVMENTIIYAPYASVLAKLAQQKFTVMNEAFIDRRYHSDLNLVSRHHALAVIDDPQQAWQQFLSMVNENQITSIEGQTVTIKAETFCLHGDAKNALAIIKMIRNKSKTRTCR